MSTTRIDRALSQSFNEDDEKEKSLSLEDISILYNVQKMLNQTLVYDQNSGKFAGLHAEFVETYTAMSLPICTHQFHQDICTVLKKYESHVTRHRYIAWILRYKDNQFTELKKHHARLTAALNVISMQLYPLEKAEHSTYELQLNAINEILLDAIYQMTRAMPWHEEAVKCYTKYSAHCHSTEILEEQPNKRFKLKPKGNFLIYKKLLKERDSKIATLEAEILTMKSDIKLEMLTMKLKMNSVIEMNNQLQLKIDKKLDAPEAESPNVPH